MAQTLIWLLSAAGLLQPNGAPVSHVPFQQETVIAGDAVPGKVAVIVNDREVWVFFHDDGEWKKWVDADLKLNCLLWVGDRLLAGTERARVAWVSPDGLEFIESFDNVEGREDWNTPWGGPPDTRSLALSADGTSIYADIHVGWIVRSNDGGKTWRNLREGLNKDVHMVAAHPTDPDIVFCATARGFHISTNRGDSFERRTDPMPYYYQRAVARFPDRDVYLCSTSRGPHGQADAKLFRSTDQGRTWSEVDGLPDGISANINTYQITALAGGMGFVIVEREKLFTTDDYGETWSRVEQEFPRLYTALAVRPN